MATQTKQKKHGSNTSTAVQQYRTPSNNKKNEQKERQADIYRKIRYSGVVIILKLE